MNGYELRSPHERWMTAAILAITVAYALVQVAYVARLPLVMDEFHYGATVARFMDEVPYRDFVPPKTVLALYAQSLPLHFVQDTWTALTVVKLEIAAFNTLALVLGAFALRRWYSSRAVVASLFLFACVSTFLERSSELRVDMAAAWLGFAALLLLLSERYVAAGLACCAAFLASEKAVYFVLASDAALVIWWLLIDRTSGTLRRLVVYNLSMLVPLVAYLLFWSIVASPQAVYYAIFVVHRYIALQNLLDIDAYWFQSMERNPLFYCAFFVSICALGLKLVLRKSANVRRDVILLTYALVGTALFAWHKQPWPYFLVMAFPTMFVLNTSLADDLIVLVRDRSRMLRVALGALLIGAGGLVPLSRILIALDRDSGPQWHAVTLAERILRDGGSYYAGMDVLLRPRQGLQELAWLDLNRADWLARQGKANHDRLLADMRAAPIKLIVLNERLERLPAAFKRWMRGNFFWLWGNVATYAPTVRPGASEIELAFDGPYRLVGTGPDGVQATIDGAPVVGGEVIRLTRGVHRIETSSPVRLQLFPDGVDELFDPRFEKPRALFAYIYEW